MIVRLNRSVSEAIRQLAKKADVSCDEAVNGALELTLQIKPSASRGFKSILTEEEKEMVRYSHESGFTYAQLAEWWNVSVPTIRRACGSLR